MINHLIVHWLTPSIMTWHNRKEGKKKRSNGEGEEKDINTWTSICGLSAHYANPRRSPILHVVCWKREAIYKQDVHANFLLPDIYPTEKFQPATTTADRTQARTTIKRTKSNTQYPENNKYWKYWKSWSFIITRRLWCTSKVFILASTG